MISDQKLADELFGAVDMGPLRGHSLWLVLARRARKLLCPKEAEAVLEAAESMATGADGALTYWERSPEAAALCKAVRAYRAAQQPKAGWVSYGNVVSGPGGISFSVGHAGDHRPSDDVLDAHRICDALNREAK